MTHLFLQDAWTVLIASLVLGAGLPVLYVIGVRTLAVGSLTGSSEGLVEGSEPRHANTLAKLVAGLCFVVVLFGVLVGLSYIVAAGQGDKLSFEHVFPTFVPK
jgi:hypothetical protein